MDSSTNISCNGILINKGFKKLRMDSELDGLTSHTSLCTPPKTQRGLLLFVVSMFVIYGSFKCVYGNIVSYFTMSLISTAPLASHF